MRVKSITPIRITEEELARRSGRYGELSPDGISVELVNLPSGAPESLDSPESIRTSEEYVTGEALNTDTLLYDAVFPDCILDPGLDLLEKECPVPAFGILKLSAGLLVSLGHRFAAVTRNQAIGDELRDRVIDYEFGPHFDGVALLQLSFGDISDRDRWNHALERAVGNFEDRSTSAVINGCSAAEVRARPEVSISVVDPTALALSLLGLADSQELASLSGAAHTAGTD